MLLSRRVTRWQSRRFFLLARDDEMVSSVDDDVVVEADGREERV
jgi:hypothetical protein